MAAQLRVFGATGFLGSAVVREARRRGLPVVAIARGNRRGADDRFPDLVADITRPTTLRGTISAGDVVLNLVGLSPVTRPPAGRRAYTATHARGTRNLIRLADDVGARAFVYVSALGVHRRCGAPYGETKAQAEQAVRRARTPGLIAAPSLLFGADSEIVQTLARIARYPLPVVPVPDITAGFRPIHVNDAAAAIVSTAAAALSGNPPVGTPLLPLVGPEYLTGFDIAAAYLEARGRRVVRFPRVLTEPAIALLSRLTLPGAPAGLRAMLAIDNAGAPPSGSDALVRYSTWLAGSVRRD